VPLPLEWLERDAGDVVERYAQAAAAELAFQARIAARGDPGGCGARTVGVRERGVGIVRRLPRIASSPEAPHAPEREAEERPEARASRLPTRVSHVPSAGADGSGRE